MAKTAVLVEQAPNGNWAATAPELGLIAVSDQKKDAETDLELILGATLECIEEANVLVAKTDIESYYGKQGMIAQRYASLPEVQDCLLTAFKTINNALAISATNAADGVIMPRTKSIRFWDSCFLYELEKPTQKLAFSFSALRAGNEYHVAIRLSADKDVLRKVADALSTVGFDSYAKRKDNVFGGA